MESAYSIKILNDFSKELPGRTRAFDVGAGIGRVTKRFLRLYFKDIDILDQSPV